MTSFAGLPENGSHDEAPISQRRIQRHVAEEFIAGETLHALSKQHDISRQLIRIATVLADAGYGTSAAFRHGLDARGLKWAVGIARAGRIAVAARDVAARHQGSARRADAWLVGEWRTSGERKYYLSNLGPRTSLRALPARSRRAGYASRGTSS